MKTKPKFKIGDRVKATAAYFSQSKWGKDDSIRGLVGHVRSTFNSVGQSIWVTFKSRPGMYLFRDEKHLRKV